YPEIPSDKDRLYVALYARGGAPTVPGKEDTYHWALIIGLKIEIQGKMGVRYHAKEKPKVGGGSEWIFEEREYPLTATNMLLVRVIISKKSSSTNPTYNTHKLNPSGMELRCLDTALETLQTDYTALCTSFIDWKTVRNESVSYCQRKKDQHRFDRQGNSDITKASTYDLVECKEITI
ncbi:uncharacterized protein N7479_005353, partial [Penicillium vulpinum]|uniref:uncharacterized protein n=1 Tax=Penicillium vulpinum TaxID=29845 RepID=UPI002546D830